VTIYGSVDGSQMSLGGGKVNHCSLHCRLAKFRGLMIGRKYGDVIGRETRFFVCAQLQWVFLSQSQRRI